MTIALSILFSSLAGYYAGSNNFIMDDGSIGLGVDSPLSQLHVRRPAGHPNGATLALQYDDVLSEYSQNASGGAFTMRGVDNSAQATFRTYGNTFFNKSVGNVGIGQEFPSSKLEVSGGDIHVSDADNGLILTSSNGSCFRLRVTDAGSLSVDPISCP